MLRRAMFIKGFLIVLAMVLVGFAVSSLMTACATTGTGAGAAKTSVDEAALKAKAKEDSVARAEYDRKFKIALSTGNEHHKNKNYIDAIPHLKIAAVMDTAKQYSSTYTKLADCFLKLDKPDSALITYQEALTKYPDNAFFWRSAGWLLTAKQQVPEAIDAYLNAIKYDSTTLSDYKNLGPLLVKENRLEEALKIYEKIVEMDPKDADAAATVANLQSQLGLGFETIIASKIAAHQANPEDVGLIFEIAKNYFSEHMYTESIEFYNKFLEKRPEDADAWEYKGSAQQNLEQYADAIKSYEKVLQIEADNVRVICEISTCYLELGNLNKAMSVSQDAIRKDGNFGLGYIVRGDVYARAADQCIAARDKRVVNFDDKLVYEKAHGFYQTAANKDVQFADLARRKMNYVKPDMPTTEDRFMHPNQSKPALDCYTWLPW